MRRCGWCSSSRGGGASSQITHRFAWELRQDFDDDWDESDEDEESIPAGVSLAPQIPFLNDDMEQVLAAACAAAVRQAFYAVLRLPWEMAPLFEEWLRLHYLDRALRVMERVRDLHGISEAARAEGKVYSSQFGQRMKSTGAWADMLAQGFALVCRRLGLNRERVELDCHQFHHCLLSPQQSLF